MSDPTHPTPARDWKPGDVAMVTDAHGRTGTAMRGVVGWDFTPSGSSLNAYSGEKEPIEAHPLLVVNPARLTWDGRIPSAQEFTEWAESLPAGEFATGVLIIADALRDLPSAIVREPTPAEPTDPAARVIDRDGYVWASHDGTWHHLASGLVRSARTWESLVEAHGPIEVRA